MNTLWKIAWTGYGLMVLSVAGGFAAMYITGDFRWSAGCVAAGIAIGAAVMVAAIEIDWRRIIRERPRSRVSAGTRRD